MICFDYSQGDSAQVSAYRAVARSEILWGLVVLGGDNVSPLVEIGLADLPNIGGAKAPPSPHLATALSLRFEQKIIFIMVVV